MNVAILGSGGVGKTLAEGFVRHGHAVMVGSREPKKLADWVEERCPEAKTGQAAETAAFGEIVVLAVKGTAALNVLEAAGKDALRGKIIIDATNPIAEEAPENGVLHFFTDLKTSLMEQLQTAVPDAHFVKAFNSVGAHLMVNPALGATPTMFICGNNENAKQETTAILQKFGWEVEDMGGVEAARAIEPLCILWCIPGFLNQQWTHAFKLLKAG